MKRAISINTSSTFDFEKINSLIQSGQYNQARAIIKCIAFEKLNREDKVRLSDFARRLNSPKLILRLLGPIIRPLVKNSPHSPPTELELGLYATALSRIGAFQEATSMMGQLETFKVAQVMFFAAQIQMLQWNYKDAVILLNQYTKRDDIGLYERLVGLVNYAACNLWLQQWQICRDSFLQIELILKNLASAKYAMLEANSLQLKAEMCILNNEFHNGRAFLKQSQQLIINSNSHYLFHNKAWLGISHFLEDPHNSKNQENLKNLEYEAQLNKEWETYREIQFFEALATKNDQYFLQIYYGSPHKGFREIIQKIYQPTNLQRPEPLIWQLGDKNIFNKVVEIDLYNNESFQHQKMLFKLYKSLTEDFYRPVPLGTVFHQIFPDEYFNPYSSPLRVYRLVARLRKLFKSNSIPISIMRSGDTFRLYSTAAVNLQIRHDSKFIKINSVLFENFKLKLRQIEKSEFSAKDLSTFINSSCRTANRVISRWLKQGLIIKISFGRVTRFSIDLIKK